MYDQGNVKMNAKTCVIHKISFFTSVVEFREKKIYFQMSEITTSFECAICLQTWCDPRQFPCQHIFCHQCILKLHQSKCPLCRNKFNWLELKKPTFEEKSLKQQTTCTLCESTLTLSDLLKHDCQEWEIEVSFPIIKCKKCETEGHWFHRTCPECKQRMTTETIWKWCEAKILLWNNGEPHVMLDSSFCPCWGAGCTASIRLFVLHKDGTMSHFFPLENDTWQDDYNNQRESFSFKEKINPFKNLTKWQKRWERGIPKQDSVKSVTRWKI